jgi:hypothetical protein
MASVSAFVDWYFSPPANAAHQALANYSMYSTGNQEKAQCPYPKARQNSGGGIGVQRAKHQVAG